jgi:hypothetical protein
MNRSVSVDELVAIYGWLIPFLFGWAFTSTSERTWEIVRIFWWWS